MYKRWNKQELGMDYWVACENSKCPVTPSLNPPLRTKEEAVAEWNTRADINESDDSNFSCVMHENTI